jgi:hypothetical protein
MCIHSQEKRRDIEETKLQTSATAKRSLASSKAFCTPLIDTQMD